MKNNTKELSINQLISLGYLAGEILTEEALTSTALENTKEVNKAFKDSYFWKQI